MRITVVSERISDTYDGDAVNAEWAAKYLAGADDSLFVPGVASWDNVVTSEDDEGRIVITADLTTLTEVADNDPSGNAGQLVSEDWVRDYILGADVYWFAPETLKATEITFA
ncbi:hypothetical protein SEA_KEANU_63 [Streptomyces phage Keanu]|nr:hypothetical protein SEA_KEANU_63 [Streptomyces phage Keanu]